MVFDKCTHLEVTLVCIMVFFPLLSFHGASCSQTTAAARVCFSFDPFLTALRHLLYVVCEPLAANLLQHQLLLGLGHPHPYPAHFHWLHVFWCLLWSVIFKQNSRTLSLDPRPLLFAALWLWYQRVQLNLCKNTLRIARRSPPVNSASGMVL